MHQAKREKKVGLGVGWGETVCINGRVIGSVDRYCVCQEPHRVNTGSVPAIQVLSPWVKLPDCLTSQASAGEQADSEKGIDWAGLGWPIGCTRDMPGQSCFFPCLALGGM